MPNLKQFLFYEPLQKRHIVPLASATSIALAYIVFLVKGNAWVSIALYVVAAALILLLHKSVRRYLALLLVLTAVVSLTPLTTHPTLKGLAIVPTLMFGVVLLAYAVSRYMFREHLIHFRFDWHSKWQHWQVGYLVFIVVGTYLLLPYYFADTGAISGWYFERNIGEIASIFTATLAIGIWEEFFFTATVLGVLQKYIPFVWANLLQASMFTAFLWKIGFHYWAGFGLFTYALLQGWVFHKTRSLLYVLVIHVCVDLLVCLVLLNAYYADLVPIFITNL